MSECVVEHRQPGHLAFHQALPMEVAYQPVFDIGKRMPTVVAYESLLRTCRPWCGETLYRLIKDAEVDGSIVELDKWVIGTVRNALSANPQLRVCINASQRSLADHGYLEHVISILGVAQIQGRVMIEVTESAWTNLQAVKAGISMLSGSNLKVVIDDIDDGYAKRSLIGFDHVTGCKISRRTTAQIAQDRSARDYLGKFSSWCQEHKKTLVVEGVETNLELSIIRDFGVELCQGFLLGNATRLADIPAMGSTVLA